MVSVTARKKRKAASFPTSRPARWRTVGINISASTIAIGAILVMVLLCYANALGNDFVFDDNVQVLSNKALRSVSNILAVLTASYRPLRDVSLMFDFAIWGEKPFGFHLTNILIHSANAILVFVLVRRLTGVVVTATIAALIFVVHPLQPDAVTYVSGRRDVLFSLFFLASFYCYLNYRGSRSRIYLVLFVVCWGLSLMSKEMAVSLPAFIFVWTFCDLWGERTGSWSQRTWAAVRGAFKQDKWLYITLSLAVPLYAYYALFIKHGSTRVQITGVEYWGGSFSSNMLTAIKVHGWYLKQLVFPTPVVQYLGAFGIATTLLDWHVILSILVVFAVLVAGLVLLKHDRLMSFAILSYFVLLLPVSQIIPHHELLADHYLYLPMMSFGLFTALLLQKIAVRSDRSKKLAYGFAGAALIVLAAMTVVRNRDWKDEFTLWQANYKEEPNSIRAAGNLAAMYSTRNQNKAVELYRRCLEIDPTYGPAYLGLATLLQAREKAAEVEEMIENGLALPERRGLSPGIEDPKIFRSELTTALAIVKTNQGEPDRAKELLMEAIKIAPSEERPYALLATLYHDEDPDKEIDTLERQLAMNPKSYKPLQTLSYRLIELKRYDEALPYLERLLDINPNDFNANFHMGEIYLSKDDCQNARAFVRAAQSAASKQEDFKLVDLAIRKLVQQCGAF
jgi:tetratricopeptide (TPR) repeat protein